MKPWRIGITGGIGSGKTRVCSIFSSLGYRVYSADDRAKWLMTHDEKLVENIRMLFGNMAYLPDGSLNRSLISQKVFADTELLSQLNACVHPVTGRDFEEWVNTTPKDYRRSFVLKEAAILFESGAHKTSDAVISVYAPKNIRISRVINRDQTTRAAVLARMDKQWTEADKIFRSDFVIYNDGVEPLSTQITAAIRFFENKFSQGKTTPG